MSFGGLGATDGDMWSETSWSGTSSPGLLIGLAFGSPGPPSPGSLLQLLQSQATSSSDLGPELLGGIETKGYRAQLPLSDLVGGKPSSAETRQAEQSIGASSLGIEFWVDSSQRLRRLTFTLTVRRFPSLQGPETTVPAPKLPITMTETLDVSDYGAPVHVTPPPANQVKPGGTCQADSNGIRCQSVVSATARS